jgi:hypothetical protein
LGKDNAAILGGDDESDVLWTLLEICGFDYGEYERIEEEIDKKIIEDAENSVIETLAESLPPLLPTRENLNAQLLDPYSELNVLLSRCEIGYLEFLILGVFILKTGAVLPPELKEKILKTAAWETDEWRWKEEFKEERKKALQYFRSKIENHIDGKITASETDFLI